MTKHVFVTGGGRGVGRAIALKLAQNGYIVSACARSAKDLEETFDLSKGQIRIQSVDVSSEEAQRTWFEREIREAGSTPWGLVTAAGVYGPIGSFIENSLSDWRESLEINLMGTLISARLFCQALLQRDLPGHVALLSGGGATQPIANFSSYCASKAAVVRLGETMAVELLNKGISVNSIAPGAIFTKFHESVLQAGPDKAGETMYRKTLELKESGGQSPDKAAALIAYLFSQNSNRITGRLISAIWDEWTDLYEKIDKFEKIDVFTLRRIVP